MTLQSIQDNLLMLCSIPSPSGYEHKAKECFKQIVSSYVDDCYEDVHGNVIAKRYGKSDKTIMLIAHIDEVGMVVKHIEENGYIRFTTVGGVDTSICKGRKVLITHNDKEIVGVIGSIPVHLKRTSNNRNNDQDISDLWIDIRVANKEEAEQLVSIGDYIVFDSTTTLLPNNCITGRGLDDKVGISVLIGVLSKLPKELEYNICVVASIQEEVGLRGAMTAAYNIHPDICIAVDVTHATDYPTMNKSKFGDIRLGEGVVIPFGSDMTPAIQEQLRIVGEKQNIPFQIEVCLGSSGTDINSIQITRGGCKTGLISIPCRYMHTPVEIASCEDVYNCIELLKHFICPFNKE